MELPRKYMKDKTMKKVEKLRLKNWSQRVKDIAALLSAIIAIGATLIGGGKWLLTEINASTNARVDALEEKIDDNYTKDELATTRLELMVLMEHDPDNVIEIEKLARHYFSDLEGNSYLTSVFSRWCREHGANCEIVIK